MAIPTEPIGSIPRPAELMEGFQKFANGQLADEQFQTLCNDALRDTIERFEATGSPVITDGEQTKPSFATYPIHGLENLNPEGVEIPFADGHSRQLPSLTAGPFRYQTHAQTYLTAAKAIAKAPMKQAVIAPSALSLLYPQQGIEGYSIEGYSKEAFLEDLTREAENDIRGCLGAGAYNVQMDFTEGRLAIKLDPSKSVLRSFIDLNNAVLDRFSEEERAKIGVHTCPGGDQDSTHSLDVDYAELLPMLFELRAGAFYIQLASEPDRRRVLGIIKDHAPTGSKIFLEIIDPIDPNVESAEQVKERVLEAAEYIPLGQLGTCDDCGFSPFGDDASTARETAFAKIESRVEGTRMASQELGVA